MPSEPVKQIIVIRRDLKMRRGKEIAQGSHASMAFISRRLQSGEQMELASFSPAQQKWLSAGFAKVCVKVNSEEELLELAQKAQQAGVECHIITDSGKTEFAGVPTKTCLALGPDTASNLDPITGELNLYWGGQW